MTDGKWMFVLTLCFSILKLVTLISGHVSLLTIENVLYSFSCWSAEDKLPSFITDSQLIPMLHDFDTKIEDFTAKDLDLNCPKSTNLELTCFNDLMFALDSQSLNKTLKGLDIAWKVSTLSFHGNICGQAFSMLWKWFHKKSQITRCKLLLFTGSFLFFYQILAQLGTKVYTLTYSNSLESLFE